MADAARRGLTCLTLKNKGSVNHDRKSKSLRERWPTKEPKLVKQVTVLLLLNPRRVQSQLTIFI